VAIDLISIINTGIGLAADLTSSLQGSVTHIAWIGKDSFNKPVYDNPVTLTGVLIELKQEQKIQISTGRVITTKAHLTFLQPITPNGATGRTEPIDERDKLFLPDGTTGPIHRAEGFMNPKTIRPFVLEVWLGTG